MPLGFIALLLACQLAGEFVTRLLNLPLPGPVIGMLILFAGLLVYGRVPDGLARVTNELLGHLSLLFVPAGVGVVTHVGLLTQQWATLATALVVSVVVTIAVTALVFAKLCERLGMPPEGTARKRDHRG